MAAGLDPHVVSITYALVTTDELSFVDPPAIEHEADRFKMVLRDGIATFEMKAHHDSLESAQREVEPFLRSWELDRALEDGLRGFRFRFGGGEMIDRAQRPGHKNVYGVAGGAVVAGVAGGSVRVTRSSYPPPPPRLLALTPDVDTLLHRYSGYLADKEPLLSMAYFCVTAIRAQFGGTRGAVVALGVSRNVLETISRLCALGDATTARKVSPQNRPLTGSEESWLAAAIRAVIRQSAEVAADPGANKRRLTLADLPPLNP